MDKQGGNKAAGLAFLREMRVNVPPYIVLDTLAGRDEVEAAVASAFPKDTLLAVRSSSSLEDGDQKSFAGAFLSLLGVRTTDVYVAWEKVKQSMPGDGKQYIIIQAMVLGEFSGVCFADASSTRAVINYLPGLCKAVVEGHDAHHVEWIDHEMVLHTSPPSAQAYFLEQEGMVSRLSDDRMAYQTLERIATQCLDVSRKAGRMLDIEWTLSGGTLYFLQARPVTVIPWQEGDIQLFDSANVGESYGGIVLPLTVTFAGKLYARVYHDLLRHSAVPQKVLDQHREVLNKLVDTAYGRMYYRMENWFRFMSLLPGYKANKENLANMLMLNQRSDALVGVSRPGWYLRIVYYPLVIWKLLRFGGSMRTLQAEVEALLNESDSWNIGQLDAPQVFDRLRGLFDGILGRWYLTVENDTVMMSLLATLSKGKSGDQLKGLMAFHSVSTDQVNALVQLSRKLCSNETIRAALQQAERSLFEQALIRHPEEKEAYHTYIRQYGARFANELKLESPGITEDFIQFSRLMLLYEKQADVRAFEKPGRVGYLTRKFHIFASRREVFRLYRAQLFGLVRMLVQRLAKIKSDEGILDRASDIFYLDWEVMMDMPADGQHLRRLIAQRKREYAHYNNIKAPASFVVKNGKWPDVVPVNPGEPVFKGIAASSGTASGHATVMRTFNIPGQQKIGVLVCERTDPGWTALMAVADALVVEHGGILSHASIVARELGIPAVIGVPMACSTFSTGDLILVDGNTGTVSKIEEDGADIET